MAQQKEQQRQRLLEQQKARKAQQEAAAAAANRTAASTPGGATPLANFREEIHKQREQIANQGTKPLSMTVGTSGATTAASSGSTATSTSPIPNAAAAAGAAAAPTAAATKAAGRKAPRRKSGGPTAAARKSAAVGAPGIGAAPAPAPAPKPVVEEPPREYQELMEMIENAVDYNWPSIGQLLGSKADLNLTEEGRRLLYGDSPPPYVSSVSLTKKKSSAAATLARTASGGQQLATEEQLSGEEEKEQLAPGMRKGWGRKNILTARAAWARIRLNRERTKVATLSATTAPAVADGLLTLPYPSSSPQPSTASTAGTPRSASSIGDAADPVVDDRAWFNDEKAEQDKTLALLSEGCEIYLKGILEKALQCARQRQNLDGIRLWHQQYAALSAIKESSSSAKGTKDKGKEKEKDGKTGAKAKRPLLSLRLGCDVSRQVSQAQGNAAMTVKRMEEALERQGGVPLRARNLENETLLEATSMEDLAWRPLLKDGTMEADTTAKRFYEIYGGKEAKEPPLGRVPKKARLEVADFVMGSKLTTDGPYHKAYNASAFISF